MRPSWPPPRMPMVAPGGSGACVSHRRPGNSGTASVWSRAEVVERGRRCRRRSSARMAAASSAALMAPASPMARVPTGMPAGICTIESRLSWPPSALDLDRHAEHRQGGHARRSCRAGGRRRRPPAMMTLKPSARAPRGEFVQPLGRAMGRDDARLVVDLRARRASRRRCAWCGQSDWLPMMMATGGLVEHARVPQPVQSRLSRIVAAIKPAGRLRR